MFKSDLRGVRIETHVRDIDEVRRAAKRLRDGAVGVPPLEISDKPSPREPWQSGFVTIEFRVPKNRINTIQIVAEKLKRERSKL